MLFLLGHLILVAHVAFVALGRKLLRMFAGCRYSVAQAQERRARMLCLGACNGCCGTVMGLINCPEGWYETTINVVSIGAGILFSCAVYNGFLLQSQESRDVVHCCVGALP